MPSRIFTPEFVAKCRRFMEAREKRDLTKEAAKTAEEEYRELEAEVWEELAPDDDDDLNSDKVVKLSPIKVPLGDPWGTVTFGPRETVYARIMDPDAAEEHYANRAMLDDVSAPKFVMARLNEEVREKRENGEALPPGVDYYARRFVSITRSKV